MMPRKPSNLVRKSCTFKLPPELNKKIQHYAIDHDLEYSQVVQCALEVFLKDCSFDNPCQNETAVE